MIYRNLGNSGLKVSAISLGTLSINIFYRKFHKLQTLKLKSRLLNYKNSSLKRN